MKKNLLSLALISLLSLGVASCGDKNTSNVKRSDGEISGEPSEPEISIEVSQEPDVYGTLPEEVLNANCDIDFLVYIEGQNDVKKDIGNYYPGTVEEDKAEHGGEISRKYHQNDITSIEMARWFAAASAFKVLAPGVKINLIYCQINEYPQYVRDYNLQKGHLPHLMWGTEHVVEMLQQGYNTDLSQYSDSAYYNQYNEYLMSRFNYGGFQAGIPIAAEPWGMFVNTDILLENYVVDSVIDDSYGECSDAYKEWVDNLTWDNFVDAIKKTTTEKHAGLSRIVDYPLSYAVPSINKQFVETGTVDFTTTEVAATIEKLLNYESELSQYCVYDYSQGFSRNLQAKPEFPNANDWSGTQNFIDDQYCTFYTDAPWALTTIASYVDSEYDTTGRKITTKVDFLPYPKVDEDSDAYVGIAVEGLTVGNQCPIGVDGKEHCFSEKSKLETDVAAYFAMFAGTDPRSIEAMSKVKYVFGEKNYTGSMSLPLIKRDNKYDWQYDEEFLKDHEDPAKDFDDNWSYVMSLWFDIYSLYLTDDNKVDVDNFSNVMYGLYKMLDSLYMIESDEVSIINYWNEPVLIPTDANETRNIFNDWLSRYSHYSEMSDAGPSGLLGLSDYVSRVLPNIPDLETDINENAIQAWGLLQEQVDTYYGEGLYDVMDNSYRNSYEGHKE